jgi:nuclear transport factor 2 (NTF2) superfamily protein
MRAVPAGLVQCDQLQRFNMDDWRQLALTRLAQALWAFHESHVCIRIQKEPVAG